jgi:hypothetical protein
MLNSAREKLSLATGLNVASANRLSLVCRACRAQRHCPELRLFAVTPGSCQFPQSRERGNMHVVADIVSRGHACLF